MRRVLTIVLLIFAFFVALGIVDEILVAFRQQSGPVDTDTRIFHQIQSGETDLEISRRYGFLSLDQFWAHTAVYEKDGQIILAISLPTY